MSKDLTLDEQLLKSVDYDVNLSTEYEMNYAREVLKNTRELDSGARDTLKALYAHGPLFDGDVPSKAGRDQLLTKEFAVKVVVKGEMGYNACTYRGSLALRLMQAGA
jgi:hypothetical protein